MFSLHLFMSYSLPGSPNVPCSGNMEQTKGSVRNWIMSHFLKKIILLFSWIKTVPQNDCSRSFWMTQVCLHAWRGSLLWFIFYLFLYQKQFSLTPNVKFAKNDNRRLSDLLRKDAALENKDVLIWTLSYLETDHSNTSIGKEQLFSSTKRITTTQDF